MADSIEQTPAPTSELPISRTNKPPTIKSMVFDAISSLAEQKGSSVHAIKNFISGKYNIDKTAKSTLINRVIKNQVAKGTLKFSSTIKSLNGKVFIFARHDVFL